MRELFFLRPVAKLEELKVLDPVIDKVRGLMDAVLKPRALEDALHGVPVGHPLHPAIVLVPAGAWISAAVLDLIPGNGRAARTLVGLGVLGASPAIITGWADWTRARKQEQRVGIIHAALNETAFVVYGLSYLDRRFGSEVRGRLLGFAGFTLVGVGGYLGGHLGYRQAVGANHAQAVLTRFPAGWHPLGTIADLPQEVPVRREVAGEALFVLRRGDRVDVLSDVSTHSGESLADGVLSTTRRGALAIQTAGGSEFEVETGDVVHGPATAPAIRFETRTVGDVVEVRLPA